MTRGYYGIGIYQPKFAENVGTLWRSALSLGADFVFVIGNRFERQASDTTKSWRHIPVWRFRDWDDFHAHIPYSCQLVGVELDPKAQPLETFVHPERAVYLLGAEDSGLPRHVRDTCVHLVQFQSARCLNVAVAGTVAIYDRQAKRMARLQEVAA